MSCYIAPKSTIPNYINGVRGFDFWASQLVWPFHVINIFPLLNIFSQHFFGVGYDGVGFEVCQQILYDTLHNQGHICISAANVKNQFLNDLNVIT
jgi:hypothetical protein